MMKPKQPVNFETGLKGMPVLESRTGAKVGSVSDLIIDPVSGELLGITVTRPDKETRAIAREDIHIGDNAIMMTDGVQAAVDYSGKFAHGVSAKDMIGARLVTEDGRLIGNIKEIRIRTDSSEIYYRVAESTLQRIFGGGFYISGKVPHALSPDGKRLIVPSDVEERYAKKSLDDEIKP